MNNYEWQEIKPEKTRKVMTKSNPNVYQIFNNVTHFKMRNNGWQIKCDEGIVFFRKDDISHIISDCADWVV
jgi:hypothetical protein